MFSVDSVNDTLGDTEQKLHQDSVKSTESPDQIHIGHDESS